MKKILFVIPEFSHGGTNKSLENLLSIIDDKEYDISIYCLQKDGYYRSIFCKYHIVENSFIYKTLYSSFWAKVFDKLSSFIYIPYKDTLYKLETKINKYLKGFDKIIAFQEGDATHFISYLQGDKIAWVHCDYNLFYDTALKHPFALEKKIYSKYNHIVCVADYTKYTFCNRFQELSDRVCRIYNTLNERKIIEASNVIVDDFKIAEKDFVIVSIGRMDPVKQFAKIPEIASKIVSGSHDKNLKWYIIGPVSKYFDEVKREISKYRMQEHVILMGGRDNPYPYIAKANLLVSTSRNEACPYVVNEAKILHVPVLSNDYPSAIELINPKCGLISMLKDMHIVILELMNNMNSCYSNLSMSCKNTHYSNKDIIDSIRKLIY